MTERTWSQSSDDATDPGIGIVLAQADTSGTTPGEATTLPRDLIQVEDVIGTPATAADPEPAADPATAAALGTTVEPATAAEEVPSTPATAIGELDVTPLAAGERRVIEVPPGTLVTLNAPAFDPDEATYVVSGNDLIVTLANGGVLVLTGFFAPSEAPPQLSVLGGPPTTPVQLLARAEEVPDLDGPQQPEPAAGPPLGGASAFRAYDQGNIGDGLDPLGPLGPTALVYGLPEPELTSTEFVDDGDGNGNGPPPPPPTTSAPEVTLRAPFEGTIGEQPGPGFNPITTPSLPIRGEGQQVPASEINNIDQRNATLDADREVFIRFIDETSFSVDTLLVHEINAQGEIVNVRTVFPGANKPGDRLSSEISVEPGTEVSLGIVAAGTQLGFVLVNHGFEGRPLSIWETGTLEFRNPQTGAISKITDGSTNNPAGVPILVHIAPDGTETVINERLVFSADASQQTPNSNRLNADGEGHYVSGWDAEQGILVVGVEDRWGANAESVPGRVKDNDFNDLVFGIRFGSVEGPVLVTDGQGLGATITDEDSTEMASATITLAGFAGDSLVLDPAIANGTGIAIQQVSATELRLTGLSSILNYETVISATTIDVNVDQPIYGARTVTVTVTDPQDNVGSSSTTFTVDNNLIVGTDGPDVLEGTPGNDVISGRGGDDQIFGNGGNDFISGGDGKDVIDVSQPGENIVIGGPQPDTIILGPGADVVRMFGLSDGTDTIRNFNATEGDRLDLSVLLRDSGITDATFDAFVRTQAITGGVKVQVDLDGPGSNTGFVDVAILENPTGVTASTDPSSFVITPATDPAVT
jgi:Ca2+-binding RTX toxin-like protein